MSCRVSAGRLVAPVDVAGLAEEVVVQGVAPVLCQLRRQGHPTALGAGGELLEVPVCVTSYFPCKTHQHSKKVTNYIKSMQS